MEAGRLLSVMYDIYNEDKAIGTLIQELANLLGQPAKEETAQQITEKKDQLFSMLGNSRMNTYTVSNQNILKEIGGDLFFGTSARTHINNILQVDGFNVASIVTKLNDYNTTRNKFIERVNSTSENLDEFNITALYPEDDIYEIGIIIPNQNDLTEIPKIEKQLHNWNIVFKTIGEITRQDASNCRIKYLNNGSLQFVSDHPVETAFIVGYIIEKIAKVYANVEKIRFHRQSLEELNAPKTEMKAIEDHEKKEIQSEINKAANEIIKEHGKNIEKGRKNELKTSLKKSIMFIAKTIDNGIQVEIITPYFNEPEEVAADATDEQKAEYNDKIEKLKIKKEKVAIIEKSAEALKQITGVGKDVLKLMSGGEGLIDDKSDSDDSETDEPEE